LKQFGLLTFIPSRTSTITSDLSLVIVDDAKTNLNIPTSFIPNDFDVFSACVVAGTTNSINTTNTINTTNNTDYREVPDIS